MSLFERMKVWYVKNFVRIDQLRKFVELGQLTKEEFKEITGSDFDGDAE